MKIQNCLLGSWVATASPVVAELMATLGFDFLTVDVEHSAVDLVQTQQLFQAIRSGNPRCLAFARIHGVDYALTKRFLDAGADGVIAPLVNTAGDARLLVDACKYPPMGRRGVGYCRDNAYGTGIEKRLRDANESTAVIVQIEHVEGVRNINEILAVPGIDGVFIGPYDLSASMGLAGQLDHPQVCEAQREVLEACNQHDLACGIHVVQPDADAVIRRFKQGYRIVAYSLDITMIATQATAGVEQIATYRRGEA